MIEFDEDPIELAFFEAANRICAEWESAHKDEAHLAHSALGLWLRFWLFGDMRSPMELIRDRDSDALRKSANDYIESEFGWKRGPTLNEAVSEQIPAALLR